MTTVDAEYQKKKFSDRELFTTLSRYISPHKKHFVGLMIALALNTALAIAAPVFFSYIIDAIETGLASKSLPTNIQFAIAAYVIFSIVGWFLAAIQFTLIISFNARLTRDLRNDAFSNVLNNNVLYFDNEKSGDITSRIVNDTNELFDSGRDIAWVIMNMFRLVATIAVLFYFSFYITLASLAFLPIILVLAVILGKFERRVSAIWRGRLGEVNQRFPEIMAK
ncbi:MAG: ABC transporter ATP-binding protein, partial [Candidatus Heimdallarchaeota archaeon]|nr:ABC transporter ATP-binding protein [Candidatus Heimdallarchaeota archaeon]